MNAPSALSESPPPTPLRVLYAEDDPQDADQTRARLASAAPGFAIEIVPTGEACLARAQAASFDVLLLDNRLPDMDGVEVLRDLAQRALDLPVVMVTGIGDEELVVKALRLGARDYVPKCAGYLESLPDVLRRVVAEHRERKARGQPAFPPPRRILYVEHLPMDVDLTLRYFAATAPHFTVEVATSSAEALARLGQPHDFDLVLADLRLPDLSGLELIREMRARQVPLPPFILVTGQGDDATAIAALRLGAFDYVPKREGYLMQLVHVIEHAVDRAALDRVNQRLRAELDERQRAEATIRQKLAELRQWYEVTLGREERLMDLKRQVNDLLVRLGEPPRYPGSGKESDP